jgi:hypothetical protein
MDYAKTYGPFVAMDHELGTVLSWQNHTLGDIGPGRECSGTLVWSYVNDTGQSIYVIDTGWPQMQQLYKRVFVPEPLPPLHGSLNQVTQIILPPVSVI